MSLESMIKFLVSYKVFALIITLVVLGGYILLFAAVWAISKYEDWTIKRLRKRMEKEDQESKE